MWFTAFTCKLKESVLRIVGTGSGWIIGFSHGKRRPRNPRSDIESHVQNKRCIKLTPISVYTRQRVLLAATSEICGVAICAFMLFYERYKVEASSIHTSIYHSGKLLNRLGFILFFSPSRSLFLSFSMSFQNTSLYSLLERTQMLKYANAGLSVILKKGFLLVWPCKLKTVRGVLRIWVTTASVMTYAWVTTQS